MSADIKTLRARVAELQARLVSYGGGDRPMSPPADLIRSCIAAESALAEAAAAEQKAAPSRPRDTAPAWAAIGEIAAAVGLAEDAPTQEVIDAVKRRAVTLTKEEARRAALVAMSPAPGRIPDRIVDQVQDAIIDAEDRGRKAAIRDVTTMLRKEHAAGSFGTLDFIARLIEGAEAKRGAK